MKRNGITAPIRSRVGRPGTCGWVRVVPLLSAILLSACGGGRSYQGVQAAGADIGVEDSRGTQLVDTRRNVSSSPRSPGLRSAVHDRQGLRSVQSIYVAPISIDEKARMAIPERAAVTDELRDRLHAELDLTLLSSSTRGEGGTVERPGAGRLTTAHASAELMGLGSTSAGVRAEEIFALARASGAESVLITSLTEFQPRSGSALGTQDAAAVSFGLDLFALDGTRLWSADYVFRDQAVSENLFRLKDRLFQSNEGVPGATALGFKSERELLSAGLREAARTLAMDRNALFTTATK
jgi:hypothetical protein